MVDWARSIPPDQRWGGCRWCIHFRPDMTCSAFPERIPIQIASGEVDHLVVRPGQVGTIVFQAIDMDVWRRTGQRVPARAGTVEQSA